MKKILIGLLLALWLLPSMAQKQAVFSFALKSAAPGDSIKVIVAGRYLNERCGYLLPAVKVWQRATGFTMHIPAGFLSLEYKGRSLLKNYRVESGDSVHWAMDSTVLLPAEGVPGYAFPFYASSISGANSTRFHCRYFAELAAAKAKRKFIINGRNISAQHYVDGKDSMIKMFLTVTLTYGNTMSKTERTQIERDFISKQLADEYNSLQPGDSFLYRKIKPVNTPECLLANVQAGKKVFSLQDGMPALINKSLHGTFRDEVLTAWLLEQNANGDNNGLSDGIASIKLPWCKAVLEMVAKKVMPGNKAYDFSLTDTAGKMVRLHGLKGKVVFMDFWFTGCTGCLGYYRNVLSKAEEHFKDNPAIIFVSVSVDRNKDMWLGSMRKWIYTSDNALNVYTNGNGIEDATVKAYGATEFPYIILLDKQGRIFSAAADDLFHEAEKLQTKIEEAIAK